MHCYFKKYKLHFKSPGGTSRGTLHEKETWFLMLQEDGRMAIGECNRFVGLSYDDHDGYEEKLAEVCRRLPEEQEQLLPELREWPSIAFGVETLLKDWRNGCRQIIFPEVIQAIGFTVPINGLIWMGSKDDMKQQIATKLNEGYVSIKLKIGAIDFDTELELLRFIRNQFSANEVEIRVDANGAYSFQEAREKIQQIAEYDISYIEQPIRAGQWQEMAALAADTPVKIALDEELIGITNPQKQQQLIDTIMPQLLILKPALIGGFAASDAWKNRIEKAGGSWVITSALESNVGLNAIAQYAALGGSDYAQGLGTGQLYHNNIPSPLSVNSRGLHYHPDQHWDFSALL